MIEDEFWKRVKRYRDTTRMDFLSEKWQLRNTLKKKEALYQFLQEEAPHEVADDFMMSWSRNPMQIKISPYILALINWKNCRADPVRKQFIPLLSEYQQDHPALRLDSLNESGSSPVQGIVHRYPNKVLFLSNHSCPVYCRFCTRSYLVGENTPTVIKHRNVAIPAVWAQALEYIAQHPQIEDVVVSGGDAYTLPAKHLQELLDALLVLPNIKRVRVATKALAVLPTKFFAEDNWVNALVEASRLACKQRKQFSIQTHFNHPNEITWVTAKAAHYLFDQGIKVRNQTVLLRGINDNYPVLKNLIDALIAINIEPYYVYMHDLVTGSEYFRTSLNSALVLEEKIRGCTSGYNLPDFVVDLPGGGGKRNIWSYRHYDTDTGISVFRAPVIDENKFYFYFDPLNEQGREGQSNHYDANSLKAIVRDMQQKSLGERHL